jgi:hypothetical protein
MTTIGNGTTEEFFTSEFGNLNLNDHRLNQRAKKNIYSLSAAAYFVY